MTDPAVTTHPTATPLAPVSGAERIDAIDILRGGAIFGILTVNLLGFAHPVTALSNGMLEWPLLADRVAMAAIRFFSEGKFYSLFSLLFGLGLTLQMGRAEARGARFVPLYIRRLLVLLGIGLLHAFLFWAGDILALYAVLGCLLLLFRKAKPRTLLIWAALFHLLPLILNQEGWRLLALSQRLSAGMPVLQQVFGDHEAADRALAALADAAYAHGSFIDQLAVRVRENLYFYRKLPLFAPYVFAMFLLGLYVGKRGIFQDLPAHLPLIRRVQVWGLILGVIGNSVGTAARIPSIRIQPSPTSLLADVGFMVGVPALCLFYASTLTLLAQNPTWQRRLAPLASVGRMALTNYLLQTLICTTIFYNYGLGLYGQVGPALGLLLTIAIYAIQVPFSVWWLRRFRFGPLEWLWRSLTYLNPQPMRV